MDLDRVRTRLRGFDRILRPETQRGAPAYHNLSLDLALGTAMSWRLGSFGREQTPCALNARIDS